MITRAQKTKIVEGLTDKFGRAKAVFLFDFKGLNVEQVTRVRKTLLPLEAEIRVVRNTLAKRAIEAQPDIQEAISDEFVGTNAVVFAYGDAVAPAKALRDLAKDIEALELKSGVMEGKRLDQEKIKYLATLPGREVLQAQFLGVLQAPMAKFVRVLSEVPSGFVRVLNAKKDQG